MSKNSTKGVAANRRGGSRGAHARRDPQSFVRRMAARELAAMRADANARSSGDEGSTARASPTGPAVAAPAHVDLVDANVSGPTPSPSGSQSPTMSLDDDGKEALERARA